MKERRYCPNCKKCLSLRDNDRYSYFCKNCCKIFDINDTIDKPKKMFNASSYRKLQGLLK